MNDEIFHHLVTKCVALKDECTFFNQYLWDALYIKSIYVWMLCVFTKSNLQVNVCEEIWDTMKVGHKQAYVYNLCIFLSHTSIAQRWSINQ
jgi:hypothetical protein